MSYRLVYTQKAVTDIDGLDAGVKKRIGTTLLRFKDNPLQYAERLTDPELGGYRFRTRDIDTQVACVDPSATIVALPDALLGQRLAGAAPDRAATAALLQANGSNPLIAGAFRPRMAA